jgi:hypothetical protein
MTKSEEAIVNKIDRLRKDPEKFEKWIKSKIDKVVKYWPKR